MAADLVALATRYAPRAGLHPTPNPALQIIRADAPYERVHSMHKPSLCFIAQGTKIVTIGEQKLRYGQNQFLYSSVEVPIAGEVIEATRSHPYIVLVLEIEPTLVFDLVSASELIEPAASTGSQRAIFVGRDEAMTDTFTRLLGSLASPIDAGVLAPIAIREIVYRLLQGPYGAAVREVGIADSQTQRIAGIIERLKRDYAAALSMTALARQAGMSLSSFHAHFRKVTTLTPLQYQKHLRLHEARRLLLTTSTTAADAGFRVGYASASQFSREYARYFGMPPVSDTSARRRGRARRAP
jgi:AraC-like DNA-binding protein